MYKQWHSIEEIQQANNEAGHYWFSPDTKRFFKSRIGRKIYKGCYFISSEQPPDGSRRYSIRWADDYGYIHTVDKGADGFMRFPDNRSAAAFIRNLLPSWEEATKESLR